MIPLLPAIALTTMLFAPQDGATGTSPAVTSFLGDALVGLYNPEQDGLDSLAFVVPVTEAKSSLDMILAQGGLSLPDDTPDMVPMAKVSVKWTAGNEPVISGEIDPNFPQALAPLRAQIQATTSALGRQVLGAARQKLIDFDAITTSYDGRFDTELAADEDGMIKVVFNRKAGVSEQMAPSESLSWLFDEDGAPQRTSTSVDLPTPMGKMSIEEVTDYGWTASRGDGSPMMLDTVTIVRKQGGMEAVRQTVDYEYEERSGVLIMVSYTESVTPLGPMAAMMPKVEKQVVLTDIEVGTASRDG